MLLAASEVVGFAKTGGLADVTGSLPPALARRGLDCAVILPLYRCARSAPVPPRPTPHTFRVPVGPRAVEGRLWRSALPEGAVPVYLVEQPDYFDRDDPARGLGLYQLDQGGGRRDYPDNAARFAFFCRAVLEALRLLDFWPDVLHTHDWHTGLVPVYLRELYQRSPDPELNRRYARVRSLFTIHNIAYQGLFGYQDLAQAGLDARLFNLYQLEFYGHLSFLKAGIVFADWVNTVSPTHAREIQTPYYGCGLHGVLRERAGRLSGIVNGADYRVWDPAHDPHLPARYSADALTPGKPRCKADLQSRQGLRVEPDAPLLGLVARLVEQKGPDLVCRATPALLAEGAQLIVLGEGEPLYHRMLEDLRARFPGRVSLTFGFDEGLAHRIEAGSDLFLMPSRYEPCGLNQMYSMRYGTVPVVRATGGLDDTVEDFDRVKGTGNGFKFGPYRASAMLDKIYEALYCYAEPEVWRRIQTNGMRVDNSWRAAAQKYVELYRRC